MKCLLFFVPLLFFNQAIAQVDSPDSPIDFYFNDSIQLIESNNAAYTNALIWIAESFGDANEVIKLKDKEAGIIVVKGISDYNNFSTSFTMTMKFMGDELNLSIKNFEEVEYGYNTRNWGVKPNACYTRLCKKNYSKWYSGLGELAKLINESLAYNLN